jgi:pimeloyl-ACP methyl ester carboxylesterase
MNDQTMRSIGLIGMLLAVTLTVTLTVTLAAAEETLPPVKEGNAPQSFEALWASYDPCKEPLEVEVLREWEQDGVVLRVLRYHIGVFKGGKAVMAAVYGFPKGGAKLPGLVQIHGGGQFADFKAPLSNAKRGYATISISWAGRISAPGYAVTPEIVQLFWDGKTADPKYQLTTDWGALDAYHAPCRNPKNNFQSVAPAPWTLDAVESPRNNPWFLCTLAARRALTFLEQQAEVDPEKLGVYGHSMGGKLTVMTAATDSRVKAAAPSCGGVSDRASGNPLYRATLGDNEYLRRITCPIVFLSPSNDFHGRINDLQTALGEIQSKDWRVTCSPHHNHQDTGEYQVAGPLWFDQHLKGNFRFPQTPELSLELKTSNGIPVVTVKPDAPKTVLGVDVYYTRHGQAEDANDDMDNAKTRFWRYSKPTRTGDAWTAELPLPEADKPLWVYANVRYPLESPVKGAGYYYGLYQADHFNLSSRMLIATPEQLHVAGVKPTLQPSLVIETFENDWQKEWFSYDRTQWDRHTYKLRDPVWQAPADAKLAIDIRAQLPNKLAIGLDTYSTEIQLKGGEEWQEFVLNPADFHNAAGAPLSTWQGIRELRLLAQDRLRAKVDGKDEQLIMGAKWQGPQPEFRNLRWLRAS